MSIRVSRLPAQRELSVFDVDARRIPESFYPHRHAHYEINWFHEGRGTHIVDFVPHPIRAARIFFMAPGQVHDLRAPRARGTFVAFNRGLVSSTQALTGADVDLGLFRRFDDAPYVDAAPRDRRRLRSLLAMLREELATSTASPDRAVAAALLSTLLVVALRAKAPGGAVDERVIRVRKAIDDQYLAHRSTSHYARKVGLTPKRINELTREALGKTVAQLLADRIVLQAKRELYFTRRSIKEVAHGLAYDDAAYFARFFRKQTGMTPRAFREQHR